MPKKPRVVVTQETDTGRNKQFKDTKTNETMSRAQFAKAIEQNKYSDYHVRVINGVKTPVSNPNSTSNDNLD